MHLENGYRIIMSSNNQIFISSVRLVHYYYPFYDGEIRIYVDLFKYEKAQLYLFQIL